MKNACIVWKNRRSSFSEREYTLVTDCFRAGGYTFEEIRILLSDDEKKLSSLLKEYKNEYDNLLFLADKSQLDMIKPFVGKEFGEDTFQGNGSSAGIFQSGGKTLFLLSADASQTGAGFVKGVCFPYLERKYGARIDKLTVRAIGANDKHVERLIESAKAIDKGRMSYHHVRKYDEDVIWAFYDENTPKMLIDDVLRVLVEGMGDTVYALEDNKVEEQLVQLLKLRGRKISVAESFTGGGIARRITSVPGASEVYFEGLNTYNEQSKVKRLGVSEYTLGTLGAVSDQTAYEMAAGLIASGNCDISIATTGLAGPNSDKSMLPVGLCYIAVGTKERVIVYRYKFDGTREEITEKAIGYALFLAYKQLKNI